MRIKVPFLPPISLSEASVITRSASFIGLFAGRATAICAYALRLFGFMLSPVVRLAALRTKFPAMFIQRPWPAECFPAIFTLQFNCLVGFPTLLGAEEFVGSQPVRRSVDFLSAVCAVLKQTTTCCCDLAGPGTIYLILFLPRRIGGKLLATSRASASHMNAITKRIDTELSSGFIVPSENMPDYLGNLRIICPDYPRTSIQDKLDHIIEVSALLIALIEQKAYPKGIITVWYELSVCVLNLPSNPLFGLSCLSGGIGFPVFVDTESGALFGDGLPRDSQMNADAGLRYSSRPCQNIRLGSNHIVNIPSYSRESKVDILVDPERAPLTVIELDEIKEK